MFCLWLASHANYAAGNLLAEAESAAASGAWDKSAAAYEASWQKQEAPPTAAFFYNFGTASLQAGRPGTAYALLSRAYLLDPFDADLRANWRIAGERTPAITRNTLPATWMPWWPMQARALGWHAWLLAAGLALAPLWWLLATKPGHHPASWPLGFVGGLCLLAAVISAWEARTPVAAALHPAKLYSGPGTTYLAMAGTLEPGALFNVEESRENWRKVRAQNNKPQEIVGWIDATNILELP